MSQWPTVFLKLDFSRNTLNECKDLPALRARVNKCDVGIMFSYEASMRSDHHAGTTWAPRGRTPIFKVTGLRSTVNMVSAITGKGQM